MKTYRPTNLRPAFGIAAVAMAILTLALSVVAPAKLDSDARLTAAARTAGATEVAISPARIDVIAVREAPMVTTQATTVPPPRRDAS
jgi:hypothetical protein